MEVSCHELEQNQKEEEEPGSGHGSRLGWRGSYSSRMVSSHHEMSVMSVLRAVLPGRVEKYKEQSQNSGKLRQSTTYDVMLRPAHRELFIRVFAGIKERLITVQRSDNT